MKQERLRIFGALILAATCLSFVAGAAFAQVRPGSGKLAGVVHDTVGTPQMGATVEVVPEAGGKTVSVGLLTNTMGVFRGDRLAPGLYTVRVTLAGFLPTIQQHVRISAHLTTVVRIELESMFASLDQLRRQPSSVSVENDDWKWVLRSASATRPVLQWIDDGATTATNVAFDVKGAHPRARLEFTDGARRPGSPSNLPSAPATAFAYDQKLGGASQLLVAGQMNYEGQAGGGGIATVWLPTGSLASGPHSALVLRESKLGPDGATFRGVRLEQGGSLPLGDRLLLRYGAEYVLVGMTKSATSLRPRLELDARISDDWRAALIFAEEPGAATPLESDERQIGGELAAALNELDSFPTLLWRGGRPVMDRRLRPRQRSAGRRLLPGLLLEWLRLRRRLVRKLGDACGVPRETDGWRGSNRNLCVCRCSRPHGGSGRLNPGHPAYGLAQFRGRECLRQAATLRNQGERRL